MLYIAYGILYGFLFLVGSCVGSFLNVVIYRVPKKISIAKGRSFCPHCNNTLNPADMIPIASFLFLHGKCRNCKAKISGRYPIVEIITGAIALFTYMRYDFTIKSLILFVASSILVAIAFIDLDTMTIPNGLILALLFPCVAAVFLISPPTFFARLIGFFALSLPMFLLSVVMSDSFGGGDVKLVAVCGFLIGWQNILVAGFIALLLGGIHGVILLCRSFENRKKRIAFGPYLCIGILVAMLLGNQFIKGYLRIFGLL
ncbi:MAG: prepilin peptidase [Oscillospiraceae bacterium]|jgi:leader peptidase (prepilin peptidase)/N-methyltransferase|nr:prepilin peptidase [Oscillospiraceae bacterium]